jgi:hypothetical protein
MAPPFLFTLAKSKMETFSPGTPEIKPVDERVALFMLIEQYSANPTAQAFEELHRKLKLWAGYGFSFGTTQDNAIDVIEPTQ